MVRWLPILCLIACGADEPGEPGVLQWQVDDERFVGDPEPGWGEVFTVVAADMEGDGDPDVMLQRHHLIRSEVFENQDGTLVQVNPREDDRSGLYDNPDVPDLFDRGGQMADRVAQASAEGLYVWHDEERGGAWQFVVRGPAVDVRIAVNRPISKTTGLDEAAIVQLTDFAIQATVPADTAFTLSNPLVATELVVETDGATVYRGWSMTPDDSGRVELWKNDPHGVAWVDQLGGPEPELFVTRGGLTGLLVPPFDPKRDQLFTWADGDTLWTSVDGVPSDYCRGRQVTWLDVDLDGTDELFVACTGTPNKLLDPDGAGGFVDVAPVWSMDSVEPEAFAWIDVDGDGILDVVQNETESLQVLLHRGDHFEVRPGEEFGLVSPVPPSQEITAVFNPFTLQAFDHDRDGDLDLWASHWGSGDQVAVLRNDGGTFTDVTEQAGLLGERGFATVVPVDVDRDGWLDLYAVSVERTRLYRNKKGVFTRLDLKRHTGFKDAAPADVDGDGNTDLIGIGSEGQRRVLFDQHQGGGRLVVVDVDAPLGSVVRGFYADGSVQAVVHGGQTSRYSQVAEPIELGSGRGANVLLGVSLEVPGQPEGPHVAVVGARRVELP